MRQLHYFLIIVLLPAAMVAMDEDDSTEVTPLLSRTSQETYYPIKRHPIFPHLLIATHAPHLFQTC